MCSHAHKATVMDLKWHSGGNLLVTASRDHLIKLYDIRAMKELGVLKGHKKDVNGERYYTHWIEIMLVGVLGIGLATKKYCDNEHF